MRAIRLSDAVRAAGYRLVVCKHPRRCRGVLGAPARGADACLLTGNRIAAKGDSWDYAYSVAHEIAEGVHGFRHTAEMFCEQSNLLAVWHRLRAGAAPDKQMRALLPGLRRGRKPR